MIPQANPCTKMCVHNIESMGSCDMTSPSAILFTWCSCAVTAVPSSSAAARAAHGVVALMFGLNVAECVAFAGSDEFCGSGVEAQALIDVQRHSRMLSANVRSAAGLNNRRKRRRLRGPRSCRVAIYCLREGEAPSSLVTPSATSGRTPLFSELHHTSLAL